MSIVADSPIVFLARATAYCPPPYDDPDVERIEGGPVDMRDRPLRTLDDYLEDQDGFVSVAMDSSVFPYGTRIGCTELNAELDCPIIFRFVDTGKAFDQRGVEDLTRIDICVRGKSMNDPRWNKILKFVAFVNEPIPDLGVREIA